MLWPFRGVNDGCAERIGAASRIDDVAPGEWVVPPGDDQLWFLLTGTLRIERPDHTVHRLTGGSAAATLPLPSRPGQRVVADTACRLVAVPARFLAMGSSQQGEAAGIELREGDIEDEVYLDFYEQLKAGNCNLPSMPDIARRIMAVIDDPSTASEHIARVIQTDPALATRVMSVVNSAAYNPGQPIHTLSQAVSRLGREKIRNLVFSFVVRGIFKSKSPVLQRRLQALWEHSCHVGAIAALLAKHTPGLEPERAMLAGLVHDIGEVPVLDNAQLHPELLEDEAMLNTVVDKLRGDVGAMTMQQWGFDPEQVEVAAHAEEWERLGTAVPDYLDVVLLAQLHAYVGTPRMADLPRIDRIPAYAKLIGGELTPRGSLAVIDGASKELAELRALLQHA